MSPELISAIKERIGLGHTKEMIREELKTAGYDDSTIESAYQAAGGSAPAAPVSQPQTQLEAAQMAPNTMMVTVLPGARDLFRKGWNYALSRLDLVILLGVISSIISVFAYLASNESGYGATDDFILVSDIVAIAGSIVSFLATYAVFYVVSQADERRVSIGEGFAWASRNILSLIWIAILSSLVVFGGFLLLIIPGIIVSVYVYFAQYVYVKEGKRGIEALLRSIDLVKGNWLSLFGKLLLVVLILIAVGFGIGFAFGVVVALASLPDVVTEVFTSMVGGVFSIIGVVVGFELYKVLAAVRPVEVTPVNQGNRWKMITLGILGLIAGPVFLMGLLGYLITSELDEATSTAEVAMLRMEMANVKVQAELYRDLGEQTYVGFCDEVSSYVTSADSVNCNADDDTYAVTARMGSDIWCVDSSSYDKSVATDIGDRTSCLAVPEL